MNHLDCRKLLVLAQALLLCACSSPKDPASPGGQAAAQPAPQVREMETIAVPGPAAAAPAPASASPPAGAAPSGLREFIDPATGQHREPTSAELRALEATKAPAPSAAPTVKPRSGEITLPNGMVAVEAPAPTDLKGCLRKDGSVVIDHDCTSTAPAPVKKP